MNIRNIKTLFKENMREYYSIRGKFLSASGTIPRKTVLVTSCYEKEGKTTAALSIAYALSEETDFNVLLIDGNFRSPSLHGYFGIEKSPGFSDIFLTNGENPPKYTVVKKDGISVLPNGQGIPNPIKILSDKMFGEKLMSLSAHFDYVIVDGTSVFGYSDILVSAKFFDGIVMVIECNRTRWEVLQEAKDKITRVGGKILGTVLNKRKYYIPKALYEKI